MANYNQAPKLVHKGDKNSSCKNIIMIPNDLLQIIFNKLSGKQGNVIKLIIYLIGTIGDGSFSISEKHVCEATGMLKTAYIEARKTLKDLNWIELKNDKIYLNFDIIRGKKPYIKDFPRSFKEIHDAASPEEQKYMDVLLKRYDPKKNNSFAEEKYIELKSSKRLDCFIEYAHKMPYSDYLATVYWHMVSYEKKCNVGKACQICGSAKNIQVHHNKYDNRGWEHSVLNEDLVCLCRDCHSKFHNVGGEIDG